MTTDVYEDLRLAKIQLNETLRDVLENTKDARMILENIESFIDAKIRLALYNPTDKGKSPMKENTLKKEIRDYLDMNVLGEYSRRKIAHVLKEISADLEAQDDEDKWESSKQDSLDALD